MTGEIFLLAPVVVLLAYEVRQINKRMEVNKQGHDRDLKSHAKWLDQLDAKITQLESERKD